eukprot:scaffold248944_cov31-Tisochrysis_lutea.AAC.2
MASTLLKTTLAKLRPPCLLPINEWVNVFTSPDSREREPTSISKPRSTPSGVSASTTRAQQPPGIKAASCGSSGAPPSMSV